MNQGPLAGSEHPGALHRASLKDLPRSFGRLPEHPHPVYCNRGRPCFWNRSASASRSISSAGRRCSSAIIRSC